ncbi:MAG: hypothetical protein JNN11_02520 [Candidatus Doudnabacteria bacterium]|nr:hypothetical protein [Candidatus Doudnabacteria bacterium]
MEEIKKKPTSEIGQIYSPEHEEQIRRLRSLPTAELARLAEAAAKQDSTFKPGAELNLENVGTAPSNVAAPEIKNIPAVETGSGPRQNLNEFLRHLDGDENLPTGNLGSFMDSVLKQAQEKDGEVRE